MASSTPHRWFLITAFAWSLLSCGNDPSGQVGEDSRPSSATAGAPESTKSRTTELSLPDLIPKSKPEQSPPGGDPPTIRLILPGDPTHDYAALSAGWYRWAGDSGFETVADNTGEKCALNQPDDGVWYLAGSFMVPNVERQCTIPAGRKLFFPLLNTFNGCPFPGETVDDLRAQIVDHMLGYNPDGSAPVRAKMNAWINGIPLGELMLEAGAAGASPFLLRTESTAFEFGDAAFPMVSAPFVPQQGESATHKNPGGGMISIDEGYDCPNVWVGHGYYVLLDSLPAGEHVVEIQATSFSSKIHRAMSGDIKRLGVLYRLTVL